MAKGGSQKRRIQQKKIQEKVARRRARRRRLIMTWTSAAALVALMALIAFSIAGRDDGDSLASGSPTPSASSTECTKPEDVQRGQKQFSAPPCMTIDPSKNYTATLRTSMGTMRVDLFADKAPKTVNNFVFLARNGYYDGSPFHRVIPDFGGKGVAMVQGGDPVNRNGTGGPGYQFEDENMAPFAEPGALAMANSGPGSNGSQFFILTGTVAHLNAEGQCPGQGCHSYFGRVTSGLEVANRIAAVERDASDKPKKDVLLLKVTIEER